MGMRVDIVTLFPEMCQQVLDASILGRAAKRGYIETHCHQIRDYTLNKQKQTDDYPYGGGCGMVLYAQPIADCRRAVQQEVAAPGRPAAVDGSLAAELTARLLKAGFTAELAARLVNVALALKSDEESGATLDLISVDLYTGTARIFKAGAAPGFLVHGGRARPVGDISLPIGILGGVNGQSRVVHLAAGDYAVLVSDGLLVDGPGWVAKQLELSAAAGDPPEKVARILVETARARAEQTGRPDDITAAVLRLEPCGH